MISVHRTYAVVFFFNDTATTEIYTLSLHDALPILTGGGPVEATQSLVVLAYDTVFLNFETGPGVAIAFLMTDRKSTRLNSSHANISYAVFCLKKKNTITHLNHSVKQSIYTLTY